jgi:hypothetical protein
VAFAKINIVQKKEVDNMIEEEARNIKDPTERYFVWEVRPNGFTDFELIKKLCLARAKNRDEIEEINLFL